MTLKHFFNFFIYHFLLCCHSIAIFSNFHKNCFAPV